MAIMLGAAFATFVTLAVLVSAPVSAQRVYRWVDQNGRVTYSQNPPPANTASKVDQLRFNETPVADSDLPYAAAVAMKNFPVTLYSLPGCGEACTSARESLVKRGIPFREVDVTDEGPRAELTALTGKAEAPALRVGKDALAGFEPGAWKAALDSAGYPASIPPRRAQQKPPAPGDAPVRLYTSANCGSFCTAARQFLTQRGIAFQDVPVEDEAALAELKKISPDSALPALSVGASSTSGFSEQRYQQLLDAAGIKSGNRPAGP